LQGAEIQLAYLSCCQSSASRAAFQVANSGVPLAIGFAYDLDSKKAAVFAKTFYGLLVKDRFPVCQAVHEARQRLRNEHYRFDPTWTAPVLVAQPDRWEWVETCFSPAEHCV
jgi:hypothetical protein